MAKDRDEAQALTKVLSKVSTREETASEHRYAGLLSPVSRRKLTVSWMIYIPSFAISSFSVPRGEARIGQPYTMK